PGDGGGGKAKGDRAGTNVESILLLLGFGGERQSGQARLVYEQRARPAEEKEDHQPPQGLSRCDHRGGLAHGAGEQSAGFRPADRGDFAYGLSAPLPLRAGGRDRRGIRAATGGGTRKNHSQRGYGEGWRP